MTELKGGRKVASGVAAAGVAFTTVTTGAQASPDALTQSPPPHVGELLDDQKQALEDAQRVLNIPGISPTQQTEPQQTETIEEKIQKELDRRQKALEEINKEIEEVSEDDLDTLLDLAQKRSIALGVIMTLDPAVAREVMSAEDTVKTKDILDLKLPQDTENRDYYIEQAFLQPWVGNYFLIVGIQRGTYPDRSFTPKPEEGKGKRSYDLHTDQDLQIPSGITIRIKEGTVLGLHILPGTDAIEPL